MPWLPLIKKSCNLASPFTISQVQRPALALPLAVKLDPQIHQTRDLTGMSSMQISQIANEMEKLLAGFSLLYHENVYKKLIL
jgi:hypothetical protein